MDASDAGGTGLMGLRSRAWDHRLLSLTAPGLSAARLGGPPTDPRALLGAVAPAVAHRWGLSRGCAVVAASGDNPCTLAGLGVSAAGDVALSLGTSDTLLGVQASSHGPGR